MSVLTLKDRIASYIDTSTFKLLNRLPIIITINGRSFSKITSLLEKPFALSFAECICSTLFKLSHEIEGAVFGYSFNDEIIIIARNDQHLDTSPWYDNNIQKISSVVSSMATLHFNNYANSIDLNLMGEPVFSTNIFNVPNITEAINVMIYKQQQNIQNSVHFACFYELLKKYDKTDIKEILSGTSYDDKVNLLQHECNIDFNEYPLAFRRGVACYRMPQVIHFNDNEIIKNKFILNTELPIFTKEQSFLNQILRTGNDIVRV